MQRRIAFLIVLAGLWLPVLGQQPEAVTLTQLEKWTGSGTDTLYVVNFWATWCRPCIEEMPHFEQVGEEMAAQKVKILFVSLDLPSEYNARLPQFLKRKNLKSQVVWLNEPKIQTQIDRISPEWTGAIPATLFIWKGGRKFHEGDYTYETLKSDIKAIVQ